jgi:N6-adenosine-specific RNA methylase IME4
MTDKRYPDRGFRDDGPKKEQWKREGIELAQRHDATVFEIGDWYLHGRQSFGPGECRRIIEAPGWQGVKYDTVKVYACVAKRYTPEFRYLNTSPAHYHSARVLPLEQSIPLLTQAAAENWNLNKLRMAVRRIRCWRDPTSGDVVDDLAALIQDERRFRGILADPPWFWLLAGGKKGASEFYYPGMTIEELCKLPVAQVAHDDSFLFLWCSAAGLKEALLLLEAWSFSYKTSACWDKLSGGYGVGAYWRMEHELLLLGVRPQSQTHFDDNTMASMIRERRSRQHSVKPRCVHEMVQRAIGSPYLELFGRQRVPNWTVLGIQLDADKDDTQMAAD